MNPSRPLDPDTYRVPGEKLALAMTLVVVGLAIFILTDVTFGGVLVGLLIAAVVVKIVQSQFLGSCVRVSHSQFPDIHKLACLAAERLAMPMPDIFITQDPVINASALGFFGKPSVLINSAAVEAFTEGELLSVLGHELSHIKCGHTRWLQVTNSAENKVRIPIVSNLMGFAFLVWSRRAEYTCDRGGLLACQDVSAAISALAKLAVGGQLFAKLNLPALLDQKGDVDADAMARWAESFSDHPFIVNRLHALSEFQKSSLYNYLVGSPA